MADTPESKLPFWSSLPGIFTGIGGVLVALTGLITALYSTGVIGSKASSNAVPPVNTAVTLASVPSPSPTPNAENDRYKLYEGEWEVTENPSLDFEGAKEVKWIYKATVSGNIVTMKGKVTEIDEDKNLLNGGKGAEDVISTITVKLVDSEGMGKYHTTKTAGTYKLPLIFEDGDTPRFHGSILIDGKPVCGIMGKKPRF